MKFLILSIAMLVQCTVCLYLCVQQQRGYTSVCVSPSVHFCVPQTREEIGKMSSSRSIRVSAEAGHRFTLGFKDISYFEFKQEADH